MVTAIVGGVASACLFFWGDRMLEKHGITRTGMSDLYFWPDGTKPTEKSMVEIGFGEISKAYDSIFN